MLARVCGALSCYKMQQVIKPKCYYFSSSVFKLMASNELQRNLALIVPKLWLDLIFTVALATLCKYSMQLYSRFDFIFGNHKHQLLPFRGNPQIVNHFVNITSRFSRYWCSDTMLFDYKDDDQ